MKNIKFLFQIFFLEFVVVIFLGIIGFRVTYDPYLITNWNAVSAVANWVSATATIFIPIAVVVFEHRLNESKAQISESNKATLAELKKFKDTYADKLESMLNNKTTFCDEYDFANLTEENVANYVTAAIEVTAYDVAMYFDVKKDDIIVVLDRLVEQKILRRKDYDGIGLYSPY